jgi:RHS repeat-associated protein
VYGYSLNYYDGDYQPISGASQSPAATVPGSFNVPNLFNGNIRAMNNSILDRTNFSTPEPMLQAFRYDQLNRITESRAYNVFDPTTNTWDNTQSVLTQYFTSYSYDAAGNLRTLQRKGNDPLNADMDQLQYRYYANTNRLSRVQDAVSASAYSVDIDNQTDIQNYSYDAIGNLSKDVSEEIEEIGWTVYGKIAYVHRTANSSRPDLEFGYDASGRRISKRVIQPGGETFTDYYVHDATGNTVAVYRHTEGETLSYKLQEWMLYGSSRLGVRRSGRELSSIVPQDPQVYVQERGHKRYELSSHLGNVHAVVSDARTTICQNGTLLRYSAVVVNYTDYYAFGMSMLGREYAGNVGEVMRYGYNGQERLQELNSQGDTYEFEYRIHDARVGRFLSVDPLTATYPWNSAYSFAMNNVISCNDLEGAESRWIVGWISTKVQNLMTDNKVNDKVQATVNAGLGFLKTTSAATDPIWTLTSQAKSVGHMWQGAYQVATGDNVERKQGMSDIVSNHPVGALVEGKAEQINKLQNGSLNEKAETAGELAGETLLIFVGAKTAKVPSPAKTGTPVTKTLVNTEGVAAKGVTLPKIGIKYFDDVADLTNVTKNQLVSYSKQLESLYKNGKIGALTRDQAALLVKQARKLGVEVRIDKGHPGTFWNMDHLNIGPSGYHVPILPK